MCLTTCLITVLYKFRILQILQIRTIIIKCGKGIDYDPEFVDPYDGYNYELDSLSSAIDMGSVDIAKLFPNDILNKNRLSDGGPDLGAYERITEEDEEE